MTIQIKHLTDDDKQTILNIIKKELLRVIELRNLLEESKK